MPNILRPTSSSETVKLNSLKKSNSKHSLRKSAAEQNAVAAKYKVTTKPSSKDESSNSTTNGLRNVVYEDSVKIDIADDPPISLSPTTSNYGALASTSNRLFQQEDEANLDMASTDQETPPNPVVSAPTPLHPATTSGGDYSRVNEAYSTDLI